MQNNTLQNIQNTYAAETKQKDQIDDVNYNKIVEMTDDEKIDFVAARVLKKYRRAFEELAK